MPGNSVSIVAECPHCESRFHLQPDLLGKAMRCPNPECREPFVVSEAKPRVKKTTGNAPKPTHTSGKVGEVVPIVEAEVVAPPKPRKRAPKPSGPAPDLPPIFEEPKEAEVVDAVVVAPPEPRIVEATVVAPPMPAREVVWSPDADAPLPPGLPDKSRAGRGESDYEQAADRDDGIVRKRKKKRNLAPIILIGMLASLVIIGGGIFFYVSQVSKNAEAEEAQDAEKQFKDLDYAKGAKAYDELANKYPSSSNAPKYRFLSDLCTMEVAVRSVSSSENPRLAMDKLRGFIEANKGSPFVKPDQYAHDVYDAGRKVLEDVKKNAEDHIKAFQADRRNKIDELKKADEMLALGHEFVPVLREFRAKEDKSLEELREELDKGARAAIAAERKRLDVLAQGRATVKIPTDPAIQEAKELFARNGQAGDDEAKEIIRNAEADFMKAIRFEREPANPQAPPPAAASLLFVANVGTTRPAIRGQDEVLTVFLAVARGVLYALDEENGKLLWATRVGPDVYDPPAIARAALPEGPTDLALVASNVAGHPAITAFVLRTGQPKWSQPLMPKPPAGIDSAALPPAPAAGPAAVIGSRAYVPVRDAAGSVLVFDIATGMKIGRITIGQAIGPGAIVRPGTTHLYIAAESRRIHIFDVDAVAVGGDAQCIRVIPTDHPTGTLRTVPIILGQPGDDPSPRFLVLSQADGEGMKLRAFPLPPTPILTPDTPPLIEPIDKEVDLALNGWSWFPPVSDSERLSVVTDRNQFRIFGINQPGNEDAPLFPLPSPSIAEPPQGKPVRGLVVPAEEGAYWVLVGGSLLKFRLTLLPDRGLSLVPAGDGLRIGEPTQAAQLNPHRDTACFVVQSANSGSRAVAVRLQDGEPRWQRQLGIIPSSPPVKTDSGLLIVDGDGGAIHLPTNGMIGTNAATALPEWIAAPPIDGVTHPTQVVASADGKTVFTITPTGEGPIARWVIRRAINGKFDHNGGVPAPGALAGLPVVANGTLLLPASDGFVHRLVLGDGRGVEDRLVPGPKWLQSRGDNLDCFMVVLSNDTFLTSDGGKTLRRWNWPAGGGWADDNASWTLRERIAAAPILLAAAAGKPARMLVADATGGIWLFALDRGDTPLRRWTPGVATALPGGKVSAQFGVQTDSAGRQLVAYTVNAKRVVCLDVDADQPRWATAAKDDAGSNVVGAPQPAGDGGWLVTELGGRVSILDAETGHPTLTRDVGLAGAVPQTAAVAIGGNRVLVPLSDGSAAIVSMAPEPKAKE
jgi:outer membrane protein assembly factor BamB